MFKQYTHLLSSKRARRKSRAGAVQSLSIPLSTSETAPTDEPVKIWLHSRPIDQDDENRKGCFTTLPIRVHKYDHVAERGTQRFAQDWAATVAGASGNSTEDESKVISIPPQVTGCLSSPVGNYAGYLYPECVPDRLEIIAYLVELGYLRDYQTEKKPAATTDNENGVDEKDESPRIASMKKLLSKAMSELADMNQPVGLEIIDHYRNSWLASASTTSTEGQKTDDLVDLDAYVARRRASAGLDVHWTLMGFSHGTRYTKEDHKIMQPVLDAAERAMIFTNDYYSWTKENHSSNNNNNNNILNVIPLLMKRENLSEDDAREKTKQLVLQSEQEFVKRREALYQSRAELPGRLRKWAEVLGSVIGGVHYWSANSPRYVVVEEEEKKGESREKEGETEVRVENVETPETPNGVIDISLPDESEDGAQDNEQQQQEQQEQDVEREEQPEAELESAPEPAPEPAPEQEYQQEEQTWTPEPPSAPVHLDASKLLAPTTYMHTITSTSTSTTNNENTIHAPLINALNTWLQVPSRPLALINQVTSEILSSLTILQDIQDQATTVTATTNKTPTHLILGTPQSMNSATYTFIRAARLVTSLNCPGMLDGLLEELESLFLGRSWEIEWRDSLSSSFEVSEEEYLAMVDRKTGATFKMLVRLMQSACMKGPSLDLDSLSTLLGRWWHLRQEYLSLLQGVVGTSTTSMMTKTLCPVLDQGVLSYPILKCCHVDPVAKIVILGIFRQSRLQMQQHQHALSTESKVQILELVYQSGAMQQTYALIQRLSYEIERTLTYLESVAEETNPTLRSLVRCLGSIPAPETLGEFLSL